MFRLLVAAGVILLAVACAVPGQKLLEMTFSRGGEVLLITQFDVADNSSLSEIWDAAGETPFDAKVMAASLTPSPADSLAVELAGVIEIRIMHATGLQADVAMQGLTLVRSGATTTDWRLPAREIARVKKTIGI